MKVKNVTKPDFVVVFDHRVGWIARHASAYSVPESFNDANLTDFIQTAHLPKLKLPLDCGSV
jgi:hypothetical protein